jgi:hypothetical protein
MTMNSNASTTCAPMSLRTNGKYEIFSENVTIGNDMRGGEGRNHVGDKGTRKCLAAVCLLETKPRGLNDSSTIRV